MLVSAKNIIQFSGGFRPSDKGGGEAVTKKKKKKKCSAHTYVWSKNKGGGPGPPDPAPGSATAVESLTPGYPWGTDKWPLNRGSSRILRPGIKGFSC